MAFFFPIDVWLRTGIAACKDLLRARYESATEPTGHRGDAAYDGIALILDRTAEKSSELLSSLVANATSIDDVTGSTILVVVPAPKELESGMFTQWVLDPKKNWEDGLGSPGVYVRASTGWLHAFWDQAQLHVDIEELDKPELQGALQRGITRSVTTTSEYLGLTERDIPSLVLLCLEEQEVLILRYGELDEPYSFSRKLLLEDRHRSRIPGWQTQCTRLHRSWDGAKQRSQEP